MNNRHKKIKYQNETLNKIIFVRYLWVYLASKSFRMENRYDRINIKIRTRHWSLNIRRRTRHVKINTRIRPSYTEYLANRHTWY